MRLCRVELPKHVQGMSLRPIAEGKLVEAWREFITTENHTGRMLRSEHYKYCLYLRRKLSQSLSIWTTGVKRENLVADGAYKTRQTSIVCCSSNGSTRPAIPTPGQFNVVTIRSPK